MPSSRAIAKTDKYSACPIVGWGVVQSACCCLTPPPGLDLGISQYVAVLGIGMGLTMQVMVIAVQDSVGMRDMGVSTAAVNFFRSVGSVLGPVLSGAILTNKLDTYLQRFAPPGFDTGHLNTSPARLHALQDAVRVGVEQSFSLAVTDVFFYAAPISLAAFGLPNQGSPMCQTVEQVAP
jgi:MFS family permease